MKKYFFEADKKQWEKPTERKYVFCAPARVWAVAGTEEEARVLALEKLAAKYGCTGTIIDDEHLRLIKSVDLAEDWNYGYGDARGTGDACDRAALLDNNLGKL